MYNRVHNILEVQNDDTNSTKGGSGEMQYIVQGSHYIRSDRSLASKW